MATLQEIIAYSKANPTTPYAKRAAELITSGQFDQQAQAEGVDLSFAGRPKLQAVKQPESAFEKVANFTGGKILAQGVGQAIANVTGVSKSIDDTMNTQMDIQGKVLQQIKQFKAEGKDTSRLENALKMITEDISKTAGGAEKLMNQNELTGKQVLGDALQLGTTVLGAGTLSKSAFTGGTGKIVGGLTSTGLQKAAPSVIKGVTGATTIGKGLIQGAKTGAIAGGAYGASSGVSSALKEDKSAGEIAMGGVTGGLTGAATGGLLGGVIGGVSGGIKGHGAKVAAKNESHALDLVMPKATTAEKVRALAEGRVTEQGLLRGGKITASNRDRQLAESVSDVISRKNSATQNLNAIKTKVGEINTGVKAYVQTNKVPFNTKQLQSQLNKGKDELKLVFASDSNAEKTYNAVTKEFMKHVGSKDTAGLLDARQAFDKIPAIKKLLDSQGLGENTRKEIALTVRSKANEYVASLLPAGNKYRDTLLKESRMIEVIGNIAEKDSQNIGKSKLVQLVTDYPILKWFVGLAGAGGVGAGGAILLSTD